MIFKTSTSERPLGGAAQKASSRTAIDWPSTIPFALAHLACLGAIWTGAHVTDVIVALALFWARMFGITAGYHRYFAHRSYRTGRVFQFLLALLAQSSAQRGVLWWAATHRDHHKYSDTEQDPHSPLRKGFWRAHVGWFFEAGASKTDLGRIPDFAKYPELVWLDRHPYLPAGVLAAACYAIGGWSMLVIGFFWSTVALWHATFSINSLAHLVGRRRYVTGDASRNNWWLALLTMGEGWHNNHHYYPASVRQGFRWHELDVTWLILRALGWFRLVRDFRTPPKTVVANVRRVPPRALERAAEELLARLKVDERLMRLRRQLTAAGAALEDRAADWQARFARSRSELIAGFHQLREDWRATTTAGREAVQAHLAAIEGQLASVLPTRAELRRKAERMFGDAHVVEAIVARAEERLREQVSRLLAELGRANGARHVPA